MLDGAFRYLDSVYKKTVTNKVRRILCRTSKSKGRSSLGTKYSIPYTMQSGWPDTAAGDTTINAGMKFYIHRIGRPWIAIICGDDSILVTLSSELRALGGKAGIDRKYASLAMEVTSEVSNDISDVEFCSGTFRPIQGTYILFPKIGNLLAKILFDTVDRVPRHQIAWMRGIASTMRHFGKIDPLCAALAVGIDRITGEGRVIHTALNPYKAWPIGESTPSDTDIATFYETRYGFNTHDINECCLTLSNIELYGLCSDPMIRYLTEVDSGDRTLSYRL